ncbi:MAG: CHAT domain-containing protein [Chitinophagales bacterium]
MLLQNASQAKQLTKELYQTISKYALTYSYNHLGVSYVGKQDYEKAIPYFKQFLDINLEVFGQQHLSVAVACGSLAGCYKSLSQFKEALQYWHQSYFVGEDNIHVFCIGRQSFKVKSVEKPTDFERLIKRFGGSIKTLHKKRYLQTAYQLYQLLLQSFIEEIPKTANIPLLTIIPHDLLTTLPFEALLCSQAKNVLESYCNFDYLVKHFHINYHYSATLWWSVLQASKKTVSSTPNFVGFAPVYSSIHAQRNTIEGLQESTDFSKETTAIRSVTVRGQEFEELKFSEAEVTGIQSTFTKKGLNAETFLHENATKVQFIEAAKYKKYILIAAHGIYDVLHPELSGIVFSPQKESSSDTAILYTSDAYQLQLNADLVVLSSCESGIGTLEVGEGMMAINRGFLYAGAKNVIFTLFKIYDKQSSQLTQLLFEAILEEKNYAQALRWAKLQLIEQKDIDPSAWTGFVLIGV